MKNNQGRSQITNEFFRNFEFGDNLIGTIHAKKGYNFLKKIEYCLITSYKESS